MLLAHGGACGSMNNIIQSLLQTIPIAHVISFQGDTQYYANEMLKLLVLKLLHYTNNVSITNNTGDNQAPENNSPAGNIMELLIVQKAHIKIEKL
ncbi:hypothetical protein U3516DRAFT_755482 [Neocallimastix sp. 'constans']